MSFRQKVIFDQFEHVISDCRVQCADFMQFFMTKDHPDYAMWLLASRSAGKRGEDDDTNKGKDQQIKWMKLHEGVQNGRSGSPC